jgi:hypothetical protein
MWHRALGWLLSCDDETAYIFRLAGGYETVQGLSGAVKRCAGGFVLDLRKLYTVNIYNPKSPALHSSVSAFHHNTSFRNFIKA